MTALRAATVRSADADGGSLRCDDGTLLDVDATALRGSPFRRLRPGQRVLVRLDDAGRVTAVGAVAAPPD